MHCDRLPAVSVTVAFEQTTYNVSEGDGTAQVCVVVSDVPAGLVQECDIVVTLTTMDNTAGRVQRSTIHVYIHNQG